MPSRREPVVPTAILSAQDMDASSVFYRQLGFLVASHTGHYAIVSLDGHELLHLEVTAEPAPGSVYLNVVDADAWHDKCVGAGMDTTEVADRPWGMREFTVTDPSGNRLRVGTNL